MRDAWILFIHQDAMCRTFHVFKLTGTNRPEQCPADDHDQDQCDGNQQEKNIHGSGPVQRLVAVALGHRGQYSVKPSLLTTAAQSRHTAGGCWGQCCDDREEVWEKSGERDQWGFR
jgi:hypothetical protein